MAASILIGSIALAADGVTFTATLSGGSGTYSLSSGSVITGLTIRYNGALNYVPATTSIVGAVLTFTTAVQLGAATTTVTITTGSNLTDSSANTAAGQTAVSVTNSSTQSSTTYGISTTGVNVWGPGASEYIDGGSGGELGYYMGGQSGAVVFFDVTISSGMSVTIGYRTNGSNGVGLVIDGVLSSPHVDNSTGLFQQLILSGLSAGTHSIQVHNNNDFVQVSVANFVTISGTGASSVQATGGITNSYDFLDTTNVSPHVRFDGDWTFGSSRLEVSGPGAVGNDESCASLVFKGTLSDINLILPDQGINVALAVDGVYHSTNYDLTANGDQTGRFILRQLFTGLDGSSAHVYKLTFSAVNGGGAVVYVGSPFVSGTIDLTYTPPVRPELFCFGDSITATIVTYTDGTHQRDPSIGFPYKLALAGDYRLWNYGIGGCFLTANGGATASMVNRTASITSLRPSPAYVVILGGSNDNSFGIANATVQSDAATMMNDFLTNDDGSTTYVWLKPLPIGGTTLTPYTTQFDAVYANLTTPQKARVHLIESNNFGLNSSNTSMFKDGVHPLPPGYDLITTQLEPYLGIFSAPTITSATTNANGTLLTATISESGCTPSSGTAGFRLGDASDGTAGGTVNLPWSISGTTITFAPPNKLYPGMTYTITSDTTGIVDGSGNAFADVTDAAVTNSSTATVSIPPAPTGYAIDQGAVISVAIPSDPNVLIKLTAKYHSNGTVYGTGLYNASPITIHGVGQIGSLTNGTAYDFSAQQTPFGNYSIASGTPSTASSALTVTPPNSPAKPIVRNARNRTRAFAGRNRGRIG